MGHLLKRLVSRTPFRPSLYIPFRSQELTDFLLKSSEDTLRKWGDYYGGASSISSFLKASLMCGKRKMCSGHYPCPSVRENKNPSLVPGTGSGQ